MNRSTMQLFLMLLLFSSCNSFRSINFQSSRHVRTVSAEWMAPIDFSTFDQLTQSAMQQYDEVIRSISPPTSHLLASIDSSVEVSKEGLNPLGNDLLIFLCATIGIVPLFKWLKASPVIGFLSAGLLMGPAGLSLFSDLADMESLADFGVLFLLFEQGLELTVARLRSVSKYAFGMGTLQVVLSTAAFFVFPFVGGVQFLETIFNSEPSVVDITRPDEALVIGAALSLSSSAFVLKILQEKGQISSKFGEAALGILLLQDIAVVPLLVLLPIIESGTEMSASAQVAVLGTTVLKALFGLGGILLIGGRIIRYLFSVIARTQSSETFVALCLLVAVGVGALTDKLGLSSTLGAFVAGTLLAESNYRTQVETDIKPFKGLLLGLFFLTTGASVDPFVIKEQLPTVVALLAGLIAFKAVIVTALGPLFQLSKADSVRTGMILSGGGEFAFVVLTLADKLHVIPDKLAKILVGVVVLSMALTPTLSNIGDSLASWVEDYERKELFAAQEKNESQTKSFASSAKSNEDIVEFVSPSSITVQSHPTAANNNHGDGHSMNKEAIVFCGFGNAGQTIASAIEEATKYKGDDEQRQYQYVAFDLDPNNVLAAFRAGKNVLYGDGSLPLLLETAGVVSPKAFILTLDDKEQSLKAVERIHACYPATPIFAVAKDQDTAIELRMAGASSVVTLEKEGSLVLSKKLLNKFGFEVDFSQSLISDLRDSIRKTESDAYENVLKQKYLEESGNAGNNSGDKLNGWSFPSLPKWNSPANFISKMTNSFREATSDRNKNDVSKPLSQENMGDLMNSNSGNSVVSEQPIDPSVICPLPAVEETKK